MTLDKTVPDALDFMFVDVLCTYNAPQHFLHESEINALRCPGCNRQGCLYADGWVLGLKEILAVHCPRFMYSQQFRHVDCPGGEYAMHRLSVAAVCKCSATDVLIV